jgi:transglutaminase-like putative cysteine protease
MRLELRLPLSIKNTHTMQFSIRHITEYSYSEPLNYSIQQLRLTPQDGFGQRVRSWSISVNGQLSQHQDTYGNQVHNMVLDGSHTEIKLIAKGEVETGLTMTPTQEKLPLTIYLRTTPLTTADAQIQSFTEPFGTVHTIADLEKLSALIIDQVPYVKGGTGVYTTAAQAFAARTGVCQDHAHIFIACCRSLGVPARYVSGYLFTDDGHLTESHAWVDAWLTDVGWVSVDVSNRCLANASYVRLATGLDYHDACPVSGLRVGGGMETMQVGVNVWQLGWDENNRQLRKQIEQTQQ